MMNRSCLLRTLQRPRAGLRRGTRRSTSANSGIGTNSSSRSTSAAVVAASPADDEVNREIAIFKKLDHPNVVKLFEVRVWPRQGSSMVLMLIALSLCLNELHFLIAPCPCNLCRPKPSKWSNPCCKHLPCSHTALLSTWGRPIWLTKREIFASFVGL
eukprot:GHRR01030648.1.p1 GENE.GHRR01030648.1~~GHRR01030648.1.p1  ORF type:complete len:157 (-),score=19.66 GHRR01030648.1:380-850(-)